MAAIATTRPQDRAERIAATCAQLGEARAAENGDDLTSRTDAERLLRRELCASRIEASNLRGHVHALCREISNLEQYLGASKERGVYTCTMQAGIRPVLLQYRIETDEDPSGRVSPLVILERVNGLDADLIDTRTAELWQAACERDYRLECEAAKTDAAIDAYQSRLAA
jgi:hypothetical protein